MSDKTHESLAAEAAAYLRGSAGAVDGFNGIQSEFSRKSDDKRTPPTITF